MRTLILILLLSSLTDLYGQQTSEWIESLENPQFSIWQLNDENKLSQYLSQDFSNLLTPKSNILGFIGSNYRRIEVQFKSIKKSSSIENIYYISGSTTVSNNTCDFEGTLTIEQIREFKQMHFGVDNMYEDKGIQSEGILIARFQFAENPEQKHVGIFNGIMTSWWYLDKDNQVQYDDLENHSDRFKNNQYIGAWTEYGKSKNKVCNWGEHRIPFSGDLDIGAGEFSVDSKYYEMGL